MTGNLSKDGEGERIPGRQQLSQGHEFAVFDQDVRSIDDLITRHFAAAPS